MTAGPNAFREDRSRPKHALEAPWRKWVFPSSGLDRLSHYIPSALTIKRQLFHTAPGGVPLPAHEMSRLGLDPMKHAAMTIDQLQQHLCHFLYVDLPRRPSRGLGMSPLQAWRLQVALHGGVPMPPSLEKFDRFNFRNPRLVEAARRFELMRKQLRLARVSGADDDCAIPLQVVAGPSNSGKTLRNTSAPPNARSAS